MIAAFWDGETFANTAAVSARAGQLVGRQRLDLAAKDDTIHRQSDVVTDLPGDDVIVAREDLHLHATRLQSGDGRSGGLLRRIEERDVAEQREVGLVRDGIRRLRWRHLLESDRNDPKAVGVELGRRLLGLRKVARVESARRVVDGVARANREDLLDRTLADEDVSLVTAFENDRHPAPLEVERNLVDLAEPLLGLQLLLELDVLQDCDRRAGS